MLMPKRHIKTKQRTGKIRGRAYRGNKVTYGDSVLWRWNPHGSHPTRSKQHELL